VPLWIVFLHDDRAVDREYLVPAGVDGHVHVLA
jgi:hypothetical protein